MKWPAWLILAAALAAIAFLQIHAQTSPAMDINESSPFYKAFNPAAGLPRLCSSSTGRSARRESSSIRRAQYASMKLSSEESTMGQHVANVESQLRIQLQAANARITGTSHSNGVKTIHYQFPHYKGSLTIGPYYPAPQSNCPSAQAIDVSNNELFTP